MKIVFSRSAKKYVESLDSKTKNRIKEAIESLPRGDVKMLKGYDDKRMRLRVGKYRIIYNYIKENEIEILYIIDIDSRGDIYK